jgi:uncharacterized membrane protein HdeD (DUF308 family)
MERDGGLDGVRRFADVWWIVLLFGLMGVAAGVIILAQPGIGLATLAVISGVFLLVDGVFEVVASFSAVANRGLVALLGVLSVITGIILVRHPIAGIVAIALLLGIWLITFGIVRLIQAFGSEEHRAGSLLVAVLEVIAGIVIVSIPSIGVATLAILIGITFILRGLGMCAVALTLRRATAR